MTTEEWQKTIAFGITFFGSLFVIVPMVLGAATFYAIKEIDKEMSGPPRKKRNR